MTELSEPNEKRSGAEDREVSNYEEVSVEDEEEDEDERDGEDGEEPCDPVVLEMLADCSQKSASFLDVSRKNLLVVPRELLMLDHVQCLYLEGNLLSTLPPNFFEHLPNLSWLDLRNNQLVGIPAAYLANHDNLRTLLIGGNKIRALPLELGLLSSLGALNIAGNPIEFPPEYVIERGVTEIIAYLRRILYAKSSAEPSKELSRFAEKGRSAGYNGSTKASIASGHSEPASMRRPEEAPVLRFTQGLNSQELLGTAFELGMETQSATLHKPVAYYQIRQQYMERVRKGSGQGPTLTLKKQSEKHAKFVNKYPEPPPMEIVERRMLEERRKQRQKDVKEKQEAILQRRRDQDTVKKFREESRARQQAKFLQQMRKEHSQIQAEANARLESGPYDMDRGQLRVKSRDQYRTEQQQTIEAEPKPRPLSPTTLAAKDAERHARDKELEARIRDHVKMMGERRAQRSAKATPQEEVEAARRDMQIAEQLQKEVTKRREALDYRFQAFTGDGIHVPSRAKDKR